VTAPKETESSGTCGPSQIQVSGLLPDVWFGFAYQDDIMGTSSAKVVDVELLIDFRLQ
jgi:hypothetical protein